MTAALLWKEYRQQRAIWLTFAILAIGLVIGLAEMFGRGSGWQVFQDEQVIWFLHGVVVTMALAQGVVTGVLLLAAEKEDGTLGFLDSITGRRSPLFVRKFAAGLVLALTQSMLLAGVALGLRFGSWEFAQWLPLLTLDGLLWGMLAGALCRTVMIGVVIGFLAMPLSWVISGLAVILTEPVLNGWWHLDLGGEFYFWLLVLVKTVEGFCGGVLSWRVYCHEDFARRSRSGLAGKIIALVPREWAAWMWLSMRQGRWMLAAGAAAALVLASTVQLQILIIWPVGTLILGLLCGLAAFAPDQREGNRFLASQRLKPGRMWTAKVLFWGSALAVFAGIARLGLGLDVQGVGNAFVVLWPLYGFTFGLFFGQVTGRPITAVILAVFVTPLVAIMWVPSLVMGGVAVWQIAIIPLILLVSSRLMTWPVLSGRLSVLRPFPGICGTVALVALALASSLCYRAVEVPDVGEPFDVQAFLNELPSPSQNKAGWLLQAASAEWIQYRLDENRGLNYREKSDYSTAKHQVLEKGWPENDLGLGKRLDEMIRGKWAQMAEQAAELPLGMVQNPQFTDLSGAAPSWDNQIGGFSGMAEFLTLRAIQLQARGDNIGALHQLNTTLALARQVKNYSSSFLFHSGMEMEQFALNGLQRWLERVGPDKALLRKALTILQEHEKVVPSAENSIKAGFVIHQNGNPPTEGVFYLRMRNLFVRRPWEQERQTRINRAITAALLRENQKPAKQLMADWMQLQDSQKRLILSPTLFGLPPENGPGSDLSREQWGEFIRHSEYSFPNVPPPPVTAVFSKRLLMASELLVAVALYQAEHDTPPVRLAELLPGYLTKVPVDPTDGNPFGYRISEGEAFKNAKPPLMLAAGQAVIWSDGHDDSNARQFEQWRNEWFPVGFVLPVPMWKK